MRQGKILITGFGPFPNVPVNASATLSRRLATAARRRFPTAAIVSSVLPTDWTAAPVRLAALHARHAPMLALHFGVTPRAKGLELERLAVNRCARQADAAGALPSADHVVGDGPDTLCATLPIAAILHRLAGIGIPAAPSDDAGAYLCNALLYHSARHAADAGTMAGFVHIPPLLPTKRAEPGVLTLADAIAGGLEIIDVCLAAAAPMTGQPSAAAADPSRRDR